MNQFTLLFKTNTVLKNNIIKLWDSGLLANDVWHDHWPNPVGNCAEVVTLIGALPCYDYVYCYTDHRLQDNPSKQEC